ncbi:MAG TPA: serine/threonine-protein kinase [Polyangiaceae bacterium]|nr:serine/threonine-protein kinase [Polyangiaceae bacterium]
MRAEETLIQPPIAESLIGKTLRGTYLIKQSLDQGGMGMVFIAEHLRLRRKVAVKVLAKHLVNDQHALARFHREAEIISQLNHPNIVQVVDFDATDEGEPYLVMELLSGESLETRLDREQRLPLADAVGIAVQTAAGLAAAHNANIVHRDLKPGNVFLMRVPGEGVFVKLLDFGISKRAGAPRGLTGEFDILGTPDYMAPEQASGRTAEVDHRGDQFALAVITYQMLTGALPFAGNNVLEVLQRVLHDTPALPSALNDQLPQHIDDVLLRALSKDPRSRYVTISAYAQDLAQASGLGLVGSISSAPEKIAAIASAPPSLRSPLNGREPTVQVRRTRSAPNLPPPVTGTHNKDRGLFVSSVTAEAVSELLDEARDALNAGDAETAVCRAEMALKLAHESDDFLAQRSIEGSETLLARIFEQRLGNLEQIVEVARAANGVALSPEQAFLLSRLDGGVTFDEALDLTPMPRQEALRQLVTLLRAGLIEAR